MEPKFQGVTAQDTHSMDLATTSKVGNEKDGCWDVGVPAGAQLVLISKDVLWSQVLTTCRDHRHNL